MYEDPLSAATIAAAAAHVQTVLRILTMIKPLCANAKKLTPAEQKVFEETVSTAHDEFNRAWRVLHDARMAIWQSQREDRQEIDVAVAPAGPLKRVR